MEFLNRLLRRLACPLIWISSRAFVQVLCRPVGSFGRAPIVAVAVAFCWAKAGLHRASRALAARTLLHMRTPTSIGSSVGKALGGSRSRTYPSEAVRFAPASDVGERATHRALYGWRWRVAAGDRGSSRRISNWATTQRSVGPSAFFQGSSPQHDRQHRLANEVYRFVGQERRPCRFIQVSTEEYASQRVLRVELPGRINAAGEEGDIHRPHRDCVGQPVQLHPPSPQSRTRSDPTRRRALRDVGP